MRTGYGIKRNEKKSCANTKCQIVRIGVRVQFQNLTSSKGLKFRFQVKKESRIKDPFGTADEIGFVTYKTCLTHSV